MAKYKCVRKTYTMKIEEVEVEIESEQDFLEYWEIMDVIDNIPKSQITTRYADYADGGWYATREGEYNCKVWNYPSSGIKVRTITSNDMQKELDNQILVLSNTSTFNKGLKVKIINTVPYTEQENNNE